MTVSPAFIEHCRIKAQRFLKSVVIVDDRITWDCEADLGFATATKPSVSAAVAGDESAETPIGPDETSELDRSTISNVHIEAFTRSFAQHGIVAGFMKPVVGENAGDRIVKEIATLSDAADVLLIDWFLDEAATSGSQQKITVDAIQEILKKDSQDGGRIRLIVIYTAEPPEIVQRNLTVALQANKMVHRLLEVDSDDLLKAIPCISVDHCLLAIVSKSMVEYSTSATPQIQEVVIRLFSKLNRGLLAATALDAIAAIREKTHHLLLQFAQEHDGAFVAHRCLLADPEDAEVFLEKLIGDEIRAEIALQRVGLGVSHSKIEEWSNHLPATARDKVLHLAKVRNDKNKIQEIRTALSLNDDTTQPAVIANLIQNCFSTTHPAAQQSTSISHLSRLSVADFDMEKVNAYAKDWVPKLALGTVIKNGNEFFLCMMPKCDSVRISSGSRLFPFLKLHEAKNDDPFNLVLKLEASYLKFAVHAMGHHLTMLNFDAPNGFVDGAKNPNGSFDFLVKHNGNQTKRYRWVTELKEGKALQFAQVLSGQLNRVGLDDFEPLRLSER